MSERGNLTARQRGRLRCAGALLLFVLCSAVSSAAQTEDRILPKLSLEQADEPTTLAATAIVFKYWTAHGASVVQSSPTVAVHAREVLKQVLEPGADFEAIGEAAAEKYPDTFFGRIGPVSRDKMPPEVWDTLLSLKPGEIADHVTTSAWGFYIVRRDPTVHIRHILIQYKGASMATTNRTRDEALALAEKIRAEAMQPGADFAALARKYSDAPDAAMGGDAGVFDRGTMIKSFEDAAFALDVGRISPVIETRYGFHILKRIE